MALLPIVQYPDDILETPASEVTEITDETLQLLADMYQTMVENDGIGIVASTSKSFFANCYCGIR